MDSATVEKTSARDVEKIETLADPKCRDCSGRGVTKIVKPQDVALHLGATTCLCNCVVRLLCQPENGALLLDFINKNKLSY